MVQCRDMLANRVDCLVGWCISLWIISRCEQAQQWLIYELDEDIHEVILAHGGYKDGGEYFIMPSGQNDFVDKMVADARARDETVNKLLENHNMLKNRSISKEDLK